VPPFYGLPFGHVSGVTGLPVHSFIKRDFFVQPSLPLRASALRFIEFEHAANGVGHKRHGIA
jgi:hypothetical protein